MAKHKVRVINTASAHVLANSIATNLDEGYELSKLSKGTEYTIVVMVKYPTKVEKVIENV